MTNTNTDANTDANTDSGAPDLVEIAPGVKIPATYTTPAGIEISYAERWGRRLTGNNLVAGAALDSGHGGLFQWRGNRPLTRAACGRALARAELPRDWMPAAPSAVTQLREAITNVVGSRYAVRPARRPRMPPSGVRAPEDAWRARYYIVRDRTDGDPGSDGDTLAPGDAWGRIFLVCTLWVPQVPASADDPDGTTNPDGSPRMVDGAPTITFHVQPSAEESKLDASVQSALATRREEIAGQIEERFHERLGSAVVPTKMVSRWLSHVLRVNLGGASLGKGYYVPGETRALAMAICGALMSGDSETGDQPWGTLDGWLTIGVATDEELGKGLARGYQYEIEIMARELHNARQIARQDPERLEISAKACLGWQARFEAKIVEMRRHEHLMGPEIFQECANLIADQVILLDGLIEQHAAGAFEAQSAPSAGDAGDAADSRESDDLDSDAPEAPPASVPSYEAIQRAAREGATQSYPSADDATQDWTPGELSRADLETFGLDPIPEPASAPRASEADSYRDHWETHAIEDAGESHTLDIRYGA